MSYLIELSNHKNNVSNVAHIQIRARESHEEWGGIGVVVRICE